MKKLVIFDFDGVLVDTSLMCYELHKEVDKDLTYAEYQAIGHGNFLDNLVTIRKDKTIISDDDFHKQYKEKICDIGVPEVLKKLVVELSKDYSLSIVSSCMSQTIKEHLERNGISKYFDEVLGLDSHRSKVFKLEKLLKDHSVNPQDAVFITDTLSDLLESSKVGIPSIAVTWGLHDEETLKKGNPVAIINDPNNLLKTINEVLK